MVSCWVMVRVKVRDRVRLRVRASLMIQVGKVSDSTL